MKCEQVMAAISVSLREYAILMKRLRAVSTANLAG